MQKSKPAEGHFTFLYFFFFYFSFFLCITFGVSSVVILVFLALKCSQISTKTISLFFSFPDIGSVSQVEKKKKKKNPKKKEAWYPNIIVLEPRNNKT